MMMPKSNRIIDPFEGWEWKRSGYGQAGENSCVPMFVAEFRKESFDFFDGTDTEVYELKRKNWYAHLYVIIPSEMIFFVVWKMIDYPNVVTVAMENARGELMFRETGLSSPDNDWKNLGKEGRFICTTWIGFKTTARELNRIYGSE